MAHFSQQRIRSIIFAVWNASPDSNNSFWDSIVAAHAGKWTRNATGFQLTSTNGAGYSQSFHVPLSSADPSNITDANLQDTFFSIIEAYQRVQATGLDENTAQSADFLSALMAEFPTVKGWTPNFTYSTT